MWSRTLFNQQHHVIKNIMWSRTPCDQEHHMIMNIMWSRTSCIEEHRMINKIIRSKTSCDQDHHVITNVIRPRTSIDHEHNSIKNRCVIVCRPQAITCTHLVSTSIRFQRFKLWFVCLFLFLGSFLNSCGCSTAKSKTSPQETVFLPTYR